MCTLTYLPLGRQVWLASNRDESLLRPQAEAPRRHYVQGQALFFPRDPLAGGSWIGLRADGGAGVLLNGAFEAHPPGGPWRRSRGLLLLDALAAADPSDHLAACDLRGMEPCTLVFAFPGRLEEWRWDGQRRHFAAHDATQPRLWSSATLFSREAAALREGWFRRWRAAHPQPGAAELLRFHREGGAHDAHNALLLRRATVRTRSCTLIGRNGQGTTLLHHDFENECTYENTFALPALAY